MVTQGTELGTFVYLFTGGEPLWELSPKKKLSDQLVAGGKSATAWVRD